MLWDYILHYLKPHVQFQNIGEGYPYNMLTEISKRISKTLSRQRLIMQDTSSRIQKPWGWEIVMESDGYLLNSL